MILVRQTIVALIVVGLSPTALRADELTDLIPSTAKFVVVVDDLAKASGHVNDYAAAIGRPAPVTLQTAAESIVPAGVVDWSKPVGAAFMEMSSAGVVLALPTKDTKGAIEKLNGKAKGPIYEVEFNNKNAFLLSRGNYLFVGDNEEQVKAFADPQGGLTKAMAENAAKRRQGSDLFFFVNMDVLRSMAEEQLSSLEALLAVMPMPAGQEKATQAQMKGMFNGLRALIKSTDRIAGALAITAQGVDLKIDSDFKEGSDMRKMFAGAGATSAALLRGLPVGDAAMAMGINYGPFADVMGNYGLEMAKAAADKMSDADFKKMQDANKAMMAHLDSMGMTMTAGDRGMSILGMMHSRKPAELFASMKENAVTFAKMNQAMGEYKQEEKTVEGKSVLEITATFDKLPEEARAAIVKLYPKGLVTQYVEAPGAVAMGMNVDPNVVAFLSGGKPPFSEHAKVKSVLEKMPENLQALVLIDAFGFLRMTQKLGDNALPIGEIPAESPAPFGFAAYGSASGATFQIHARSDTVKELLKLGPGN